ncbi:MAG: hypothetical protein Kow006_30210 [Gammaproteobacteria bacterium]
MTSGIHNMLIHATTRPFTITGTAIARISGLSSFTQYPFSSDVEAESHRHPREEIIGAVRNILFIMCDQLGADHLGCTGHPTIRSPLPEPRTR